MDADESEAYQHLEHDLGFNLSSITARTRPDSGQEIVVAISSLIARRRFEEGKGEENRIQLNHGLLAFSGARICVF